MISQTTKEVRAATQLRDALKKWKALHPKDSDAVACSKANQVLKSKERRKPNITKRQRSQISKVQRAVFGGDIPPFQERVFLVLKKAGEAGGTLAWILDQLKAKDWAPASQTDENARTYICAVVGKDTRIVRIASATYRVRPRYLK